MRTELLTRRPTVRRACTSMTKATHSQPCQVETLVNSNIHNWLHRRTLNTRFTRFYRHGALV